VTRPFFDGKWMVHGAESVSHTRRRRMLSCCLHCILDSTLVVFVVAHSKREMEELRSDEDADVELASPWSDLKVCRFGSAISDLRVSIFALCQ
jgi:hypothetical protein